MCIANYKTTVGKVNQKIQDGNQNSTHSFVDIDVRYKHEKLEIVEICAWQIKKK